MTEKRTTPRKRAEPKKAAPLVEGGRVDETQKLQGIEQTAQGVEQTAQHDRLESQQIEQDAQGVAQVAQGAEQVVQHNEQQVQAVRQTEQGLRQDEQGTRQDDQGTTLIEQGEVQIDQRQIQRDQGIEQARQATQLDDQTASTVLQGEQVAAMADGVELLTHTVTTLNERVYAKNHLDRTRNGLIAAAIAFFVVASSLLGLVLYEIREQGIVAAARSTERENEARDREQDAIHFRRSLADCTVAPGVVFEDGYVNPGVCYTEGQQRTGAAVETIVVDVTESVRQLLIAQAEAAAANRALADEVRRSAAVQADALRRLIPSTTVPQRATSPPTVTTTTSPLQAAPPPPSSSGGGGLGGVVCSVLGLIGLCD